MTTANRCSAMTCTKYQDENREPEYEVCRCGNLIYPNDHFQVFGERVCHVCAVMVGCMIRCTSNKEGTEP